MKLMKYFQVIIVITGAVYGNGNENGKAVYESENWAFHFPANSNMGIFIALAIPIEDPNENVFLAYNFEANYLLPGNESETVEFPTLVTDSETEIEARQQLNKQNRYQIDRKRLYQVIEAKLQTYNYPGRQCLLRIICEVATSYSAHNGILHDLIHVVFTPSSSLNRNISSAYEKAERYGKKNLHCQRYENNCLKSFYDLISWISHV